MELRALRRSTDTMKSKLHGGVDEIDETPSALEKGQRVCIRLKGKQRELHMRVQAVNSASSAGTDCIFNAANRNELSIVSDCRPADYNGLRPAPSCQATSLRSGPKEQNRQLDRNTALASSRKVLGQGTPPDFSCLPMFGGTSLPSTPISTPEPHNARVEGSWRSRACHRKLEDVGWGTGTPTR